MKKMITVVLLLIVAVAFADDTEAETTSGSMLVVGEDGIVGDLPLQHTDVEITISGNLQRATVKQVYGNPYDYVIEAVYTFPLPQSGAVDRMNMWIGDRLIVGEIHEREFAQQIYQEAIEAGQTASLLEQERPNIFTQSVGNILPGDSIVIEISYVAPVEYDDGEYEIVFPMVVGPRFNPPGGLMRRIFDLYETATSVEDADRITPPIVPEGTRTGYDIDISVTIDAGIAIQNIESLNHETEIVIERSGTAYILLKNDSEIPNRDFVLRYSTATDRIETGIITHNGNLGGHFMLILQPDIDIDVSEITAKEMFFVVDCSGSMSGQPMEVAKETVRQFVSGMNPDDTFQIMRFSETASSMSPIPLSNTEQNVEKGLRYINCMSGTGGTMMIEGIRSAIGYPEDPERMRFVIFLTDGFIGNEAEILRELQSTLGENTRLFSVGVGSSPNRYLIEGLAEEGRGQAYYVGLNEDPDESVTAIYDKINNPYLVGIDIDWGNLNVHDVYPSRIPDLFAGEPLVIVGQYDGYGTDEIEISGRVAGRNWSTEIDVNFPATQDANDVIAILWARKKIHDLNRDMYSASGYLQNNQDIIDEITDTALDYRIMSEYTSFVAVSEEVRTDPDGNPVTVKVPVNMPDGVSYDGVFGVGAEGDYSGGQSRCVSPAPTGGINSILYCIAEEYSYEDGYYEELAYTPVGDVRLISASPTLSLLPSTLRGAVRELLNEMTEVYQAWLDTLDEDEDPAVGFAAFEVEVDSSGNIVSVSIDGEGIVSEVDNACAEILEELKINAPPAGAGTIRVQLEFRLI